MARKMSCDFQTRLEICEAEKKDLQDEVKYMKESIEAKNEEIGSLKCKLRNSAQELSELEHFLMGQVSALTARLTKPVQESLPPGPSLHPISSPNPCDQNANQETLLNNSVLSQVTQPTEGARLAPLEVVADVLDILDPQPTLPSSSTQPISARPTRPILISDDEAPLAKKSLFECGKCKSKFCTAVKLNNHIYTMHGNSSSSDDPFTPIANAEKNKARKLRNRTKKVKLEPPEIPSLPIKVPKTQVTCPGCGKKMYRKSLGKHTKLSCKGSLGDPRAGGVDEVSNSELTCQSEDEISFKVRSTYKSGDGENLFVKMKVKPFITIGKVKDKFSRRLAVSMDRLVLRCNGKLLEDQESVRNLDKQTVWLSVVEVKDEGSI